MIKVTDHIAVAITLSHLAVWTTQKEQCPRRHF